MNIYIINIGYNRDNITCLIYYNDNTTKLQV